MRELALNNLQRLIGHKAQPKSYAFNIYVFGFGIT